MGSESPFPPFAGPAGPVLPTPAGVYAFLLGEAKWSSEADRQVAELLQSAEPAATASATENRQYIGRSVTYAAELGISQFLDLGCGYPMEGWPAIHQIAAGSRVVYADNDPAVVAAWEQELAGGPGQAAIVSADLRDPARSLAAAAGTGLLDPAMPVCLVLGVVLQYIPPADVRLLIAAWSGLAAPGSCMIISVGRAGSCTHSLDLVRTYRASPTHHPSREEIRSWLGDWDLVPPGMCEARAWRTGAAEADLAPRGAEVWCGVAVKPAAGSRPPAVAAAPAVPAGAGGPVRAVAAWNETDALLDQLRGRWPQVILRYLPSAAPGTRPSELLAAINAGRSRKLSGKVLFEVLRRLTSQGLVTRTEQVWEGRRITFYRLTANGRDAVSVLRRAAAPPGAPPDGTDPPPALAPPVQEPGHDTRRRGRPGRAARMASRGPPRTCGSRRRTRAEPLTVAVARVRAPARREPHGRPGSRRTGSRRGHRGRQRQDLTGCARLRRAGGDRAAS